MRRPLLSALAAALLLAPAGCGIGSGDAGGGVDDSDKRAVALACLEEEGVAATLKGDEEDQEIVIGDAADAPRVRFFLTSGESVAAQFEGHGEGAEQIGSTLLYTNGGSDELLETVEGCLDDL